MRILNDPRRVWFTWEDGAERDSKSADYHALNDYRNDHQDASWHNVKFRSPVRCNPDARMPQTPGRELMPADQGK